MGDVKEQMGEVEIAFVDLKAQRDRIRDKVDSAISRVVDHCGFIMGREVGEFEALLAAFTGAKHVVCCANGTDALQLVLMAEGVGPGDAVFVPSMTFIATAEVVPLVGATPVFVDVRSDTFNMDAGSLEAAIGRAKELSLKPRAVIPVDLFGQPADYLLLNAVARAHGLVAIADAAQAVGGSLNLHRVGTLADWTTTSFFPAKPLGCYGDGGAVMTDDGERADILRSLRNHGQGSNKFDNVRVGLNSRMDTIQAAVLIEKLAIFEDELEARNRVAQRYSNALRDLAKVPVLLGGATSAWAQYTLKVDNRDAVREVLEASGVPSVVYYPTPVHQQPGYIDFPRSPGGLPVSDRLAKSVLSLPVHPYLDEKTQDQIIGVLRGALIKEGREGRSAGGQS